MLEQFVPEGFPLLQKWAHAEAVHEELQPVRKTPLPEEEAAAEIM